MEINELRNIHIRCNSLQNTDEIYTFYYDETNNIRKLYLKPAGLNVEKSDNFILAGIAHKGLITKSDISDLFKKLDLQKNISELKFRHIAKGNFLDLLKSERLFTVFQWLVDNDFYIHYSNLNIVYWSVIDIIDSIIGELNHPFYIMHHMSLKSDFYDIANSNLEPFLTALYEFNYPDFPQEKGVIFCHWLINFVNMHSIVLTDFRATLLKSLISESLRVNELPFISGFNGRELISNFSIFYLRNLYIFKNSTHIFDEEKSVQDKIKTLPLTENGELIQNHVFVKSHDSEAVQLSDVIAGFLGKYFSYLKDVDDEQVVIDKTELNHQQNMTLSVLKNLIDASADVSKGFHFTVSSEGEKRRNNYFLHNIKI